MKKSLKALLIGLLAVMCVCCAVACQTTYKDGETIYEDQVVADLIENNQQYTVDSANAYGETPDIEGVVIDGYFDDAIWQNKKWYTQYQTENPNVKFSVTATTSEKGLYIAAKSDDKYLFWNGRNRYYYNTAIQIQVGNLNVKIDANNPQIFGTIFNIRNRYEGELNKSGEGKGLFVEMFVTWESIGYDTKQDVVSIFPTYWSTLRSSTAPTAMYPTFVNAAGNENASIKFDENGYIDGDEENAKIGTHELGLAKTNGWKIENAGTDEETTTALMTTGNTGFIKAAFFRNLNSSRYMLTTRITFNSAQKNNSRAGLLMYINNQRYRAITLDINNTNLINGSLTSVPVNAYTNYPTNITTTTNIGEFKTNTENGRKANEVDLTLFNNNGSVYYLVNGEFVYSEDASYITNGFGGFYVFNADVTFSNYECKEFKNEAAIKAEIAKYCYTVEIKNENRSMLTGSLTQIATANTGKGTVDVELSFLVGKDVSEGYRAYELEKLYYVYTDENGESKEVDLTEDAKENAKSGIYTIKDVPGNIVIHTKAKEIIYSNDQVATLSLRMWDNNNGTSVTGVSVVLEGSGSMDRFSVTNGTGGYLTLKVVKGKIWHYTATKSGYRATSGYVNEGAIINSDMISRTEEEADVKDTSIPADQKRKTERVYMQGSVVGGEAISMLDPDGNAYTKLVKASSPGIYWNLDEEENSKVTFTSTNTGSSVIYFSGRTISDYQVAYVEITNQTDYLAFQSIEDDPAGGFYISNNTGNTLIGLRGTGIRICPAGMKGWNPIEKNGMMNYSGPLAKIDRNNNGRIDLDNPYSMGTGSINRIPLNGETYTTSLLMIRRGGTIYVYAANGAAGVQTDKTNFDKMTLIYQTYLDVAEGYAAIGFGITVSYNLRLDFENYWILAGNEDAGAFADDIISSEFEVKGTEIVNVASSGLIGYDETTGKGRVAVSSEVTLTAKNKLPEGKIIKITKADGSVAYISENDMKTSFNVGSAKEAVTIKAELVDSVLVTGSISVADKDISVADRTGCLYDTNGNEVATFVTDENGAYSLHVEKNAEFKLTIGIDGYAMNPVSIKASSDTNLGDSAFSKLMYGGKVGTLSTKDGWSYGIDEKYHGAYAKWENSNGDTTLVLNSEYNNKTDFVLTFSYVRSSAAVNGSTNGDELDPGVGIVMYGSDASNIQVLGINNGGYRILRPSWNGRVAGEGAKTGKVNFQNTNVPLDRYAMVKIVKTGNTIYLLTKYSTDAEYTLTCAWVATNDSGVEILNDAVTFGIKVTATSGKYLNMTFFDIDVQDVNKETAPEIISTITVEQSVGGTIAVDGLEGNSGEIVGAGTLKVTVTPDAEKKLTALKVGGQPVDLGNYKGGVFTGNVSVKGNAVITAEYGYVTYETKIEKLSRNERNKTQLVVLTNGSEEIVLTVTEIKSKLSESVAYIDKDGQSITLFAPKGEWTVTFYGDADQVLGTRTITVE